MSENRPDGGPAFSRPATLAPDGTTEWGMEPGMTLRDYFAAAALGRIGYRPGAEYADEERMRIMDRTAADCYRLADAMLRGRVKGGES